MRKSLHAYDAWFAQRGILSSALTVTVGTAWVSAVGEGGLVEPRATHSSAGRGRPVLYCRPRPAATRAKNIPMVDFNLINSFGDLDDEINSAVMTAFGSPDIDINTFVTGGEVQDLVSGAIVTGKVSARVSDDFVVDLGRKSEGILERGEFDEPVKVQIGDEVRVLVEDVDGDQDQVRISKRKADRIINWEAIMKSKKEGDPVSGKVTKKIKGGLLVDIGVPVFLPASQVDIRRPGEISDWIGRHIDAMILKIDEERRNIVISRRKMIEVMRDELKKKTLETLKVGDIVKGTVKNIADFGAFIDLG
ncbi:MAG: rpsA, partial [Phycisphaerales bacterium]|nr:rpsA [Phycisphaerales bacterium]